MNGGNGPAAAAAAVVKTNKQPHPDLTADNLTALLSLVASATALSHRFLSDNDLLLLPSQALTLDSSLRSAALSISRLLQTLTPQTLTLDIPPPPHPLSSPSWFLRFLSSSSSHSADPRWLETFRMSRPSFYLLLQTLSPSLHSSPLPIPADHKLGAALFRLAHAAPFRVVARRFGLPSPALACRAFYEACKAVADQLGHLFELPSDVTRVLQGFHWMSLPNCCGALGYAQFPVDGASHGGSVVAQGLVDSEGRFLDVSAGWHGLMSPSQILTQSKLYKAQAMVLKSGPPVQLHGGSVPRYLLGGSCCPLLPWLLTPFPGVEASLESSKAAAFNVAHARGMQLANKAFGRVRARWQLLRTRWKEECTEALPIVIIVSCLLHNYLIKCSEPMPDEAEVGMSESRFPEFEGKEDEGGEKVREVLASHLSLVTMRRK